MARYCDAKDLRALVPDLYRDAALADSAGGTEADAGLLAAVLESACNEVDALVEGRVRLPLATVPRKLRVAAAYIALELLSIRRSLNLREDAAAKVQWWRNWLSKVGEGELRLDAPAPDAAGAFSGHSSSVAVRPSVTGTHGLMFGLLLAFPLFALVPAETSRAVEARTWAFDLPEAADVFDNPTEMEWAAGESLVLSYAGGSLSDGQTARWEVASGTNLWLALAPDAAGSPWTWSLAPTQTCLPSGRYAGRIAVYETDGTEATFARVAALQSIRVHQGAAGLATANPLAVLSDYALLSWAEAQHSAIARDIATNAAAIADLEETGRQHADALAANAAALSALQAASDALASRADGLDAATDALGGRLDSAEDAIAANSAAIGGLASDAAGLQDAVGGLQDGLGGYLAKTNGDWVAVQSGLWHGLTWAGSELFGAALLVETNQARITGLQTGSGNTAVITFLGSATTNRLQATTNAADWTTWNDCTWSYSGRTGTVTVANAAPGTFWRILAVDGTPDRTNVFLVASVPVYLGDTSVPGNRLATLADVQEAVERGGGAAKPPVVTRRAYKDNMSAVPTNGVAWNFANDGVYIADLSVGGWTEETATVTTNEGTVATNTTTVTHPGTMTFNGETIRSWAELATYADGVEIVPGVATLNGQRGDLSIEAGDNVTITETDGALVISTEGGGVTALNSMSGPVTIVGANGISVSTASGADNLLIVSGGGGGGGGSGSADTNAIVAAAVAAVEAHDFQTLTLGGVARNAWPTGGGGAWTPSSRIVTATNATVLASDMLIWMDSEAAEDDQTIFLPDMATESQTVVIRHLGGDHPTTIVRATAGGTNTYTLAGDGAAVAVDWLGIKTNWYWRQAY